MYTTLGTRAGLVLTALDYASAIVRDERREFMFGFGMRRAMRKATWGLDHP